MLKNFSRTFIFILFILACCIVSVRAHPMGNFSINHYTGITVEQDAILVHHIIDMAEVPAYTEIKNKISRGGDGKRATPAEIEKYRPGAIRKIAGGLKLNVDGRAVKLQVLDSKVELLDGLPGLKTIWYEMHLRAPFKARAGKQHTVTFRDTNWPEKSANGWKEIELFDTHTARITERPELSDIHTDKMRNYPEENIPNPPQDISAKFRCELGPGATTASKSSATKSKQGPLQRFMARLPQMTEFLERRNYPAWFIAFALCMAFFIGCTHALSPGHGKTLVGAYLIGSNGTVADAMFLGLVVTVSHVASVLILGVIIHLATTNITSDKVYPWFEGASGLLIILIGIWMFARNAMGRGPAHVHDQYGRHVHPGHDHHDHHGHDHDHDHNHDHDHHHHHDHAHDHHHDHEHSHALQPGRASRTDILMLGVTGGIVPCPTALMVLFAAVALHKVAFGLGMIVAFSFGLAFVLILIGILMVKAKDFMDKHLNETGAIRFLPYVSAAVITLIGCAFTLRAARALGWF